MKPLNCCKGCSGLKDGEFRNKLRCMLCNKYAEESTLKLYNELKDKRGCSTCAHCKHVNDYPAFVIAEECVCMAGLECDTVLFTVKDCKEWVGKYEDECD